jgi:hypothetical protein
MSTIPVNLATEDRLSEAVLRKLLLHSDRGYAIGTAYGHSGFGYLRKTIVGWNRGARGIPFVVLTDLDLADCPLALTREWLSGPKHPNLLFRVAVREVESWLLSDPEHLAAYLGVRRSLIPDGPDQLQDPKYALVELAKRSRFAGIRSRIVPRRMSTAKEGPDYNGCLIEFVDALWDVDQATHNSPSLRRTVDRLAAFTPTWT